MRATRARWTMSTLRRHGRRLRPDRRADPGRVALRLDIDGGAVPDLKREEAARFSFCSACRRSPLAGLKEIYELHKAHLDATAGRSGGRPRRRLHLGLRRDLGLMRVLERFSTWPFVVYRAVIGVCSSPSSPAGCRTEVRCARTFTGSRRRRRSARRSWRAASSYGRWMTVLESLIWRRRREAARDQVELLVGSGEQMRPARISSAQARLAHVVGHIEIMELVRGPSSFKDAAHPCPVSNRVRRKIQDDREAGLQQVDEVRLHRVAEPPRTAHVIGDRRHLPGIETAKPLVLAHDDAARAAAQFGSKG